MKASKRRRVLFIINSMAGGGAERVMAQLLALSHGQSHSYDIHLALLDREAAAYSVPDWIKVHELDCHGSLVASILQLRSLIAQICPDVRLSFLTRANIASALADWRSPCILSERVNTQAHLGRGIRGYLSGMIVRLVYRHARSVIAVSEGVANGLIKQYGVCPSRSIVIANPVDVEAIRAQGHATSPLPEIGPYVVAVGRLTRNKNFAMLIQAFAKAYLPAKLVIVGEGEERIRLEGLISDLGLTERVLLPGFLANPYAVVSKAELFALSSDAEGFPNALVESMALGVPVVATNCADGPAEILAGKRREDIEGFYRAPAGLLVPTGDTEAFARALRVGFDPPIRNSMIIAASARLQDFAPEAAVDRYWSVIKDALKRPSPLAE